MSLEHTLEQLGRNIDPSILCGLRFRFTLVLNGSSETVQGEIEQFIEKNKNTLWYTADGLVAQRLNVRGLIRSDGKWFLQLQVTETALVNMPGTFEL